MGTRHDSYTGTYLILLLLICVTRIYAQDPEESNCVIFDTNICDCYDMCHSSGHPTINGCPMETLSAVNRATRERCGIKGNFEQDNNPFNIFPPGTPGLILPQRRPQNVFGPPDTPTNIQSSAGDPVGEKIFGARYLPSPNEQSLRIPNGRPQLRGRATGLPLLSYEPRPRPNQRGYGVSGLNPLLPQSSRISTSDTRAPSLRGPLGSNRPHISLGTLPRPQEVIHSLPQQPSASQSPRRRLVFRRKRPVAYSTPRRLADKNRNSNGHTLERSLRRKPPVLLRRRQYKQRYGNVRFPRLRDHTYKLHRYNHKPQNKLFIRPRTRDSRRGKYQQKYPSHMYDINLANRPPPPLPKQTRPYPGLQVPAFKRKFTKGYGDIEQPTHFPIGLNNEVGGLVAGGLGPVPVHSSFAHPLSIDSPSQLISEPVPQPIQQNPLKNSQRSLTLGKVEEMLQKVLQKMAKQHKEALQKATEELSAKQPEKQQQETTKQPSVVAVAIKGDNGTMSSPEISKLLKTTTAILSKDNKLKRQRKITDAKFLENEAIKAEIKKTKTEEEYMYGFCEMAPNPVRVSGGWANITGRIDIRQRVTDGDIGPAQIRVSLRGFDVDAQDKVHGFHVHEFGDLSGGCDSAGGHYNPFKRKHGGPQDVERHVGDLGNLVQNEDGNAFVFFSDKLISLVGPYSVLGRTVVINGKADDFGPGGNPERKSSKETAERLACCVIGQTNDDKWEQNKP